MTADYQVGDIVRYSRTIRITEVGQGYLEGNDKTGFFIVIPDSGVGSLKIEMVKRAARPKPKAGEVISGKELKKIQWKRGTIIHLQESKASALVLFEDGYWRPLDNLVNAEEYFPPIYRFGDLQDDVNFELLHVA